VPIPLTSVHASRPSPSPLACRPGCRDAHHHAFVSYRHAEALGRFLLRLLATVGRVRRRVARTAAREEAIAENYARARTGVDAAREHVDAIREEVDANGEEQRKSLLNILHTVVSAAEFTVKDSDDMYDALEAALEDVENTEIASQQARQLKARHRCVHGRLAVWSVPLAFRVRSGSYGSAKLSARDLP
jgi:hypothetical protein